MKISFQSRRGSALLVVLGMLSFMLFSGIAFSVYMRQSRLPTSFLRRTVATRQLAKAALAEAIEEIDTALGNDPHPGVRASGKAFSESRLDNFWKYRVFTAYGTTTNPEQQNSSGSSQNTTYYPELVDADETVPTLTLEGLAYLPPNLINEVRYYSQRTPTAKWHSFWFDSGRYAYTAIDVSDYFDVNRMFANKPRAACGSRRLSFAHIFEEGADHSGAGTGADKWETFMAQYRSVNNNTDEITYPTCPFVSLADFNVAWGSRAIGDLKCPFYNFVTAGRAYDCGKAADDPDAEKYRCMTFVTDSWAPDPVNNVVPGTSKRKLDLCGYQPFSAADLENDSMSLDMVVRRTTDSNTGQANLRDHLCLLGIAQLYDYLDVNSVPLSLAIPTLERTPMIVGIEPKLPPLKFEMRSNVDFPDNKDKMVKEETDVSRTYQRTEDYYIMLGSRNVAVNVLAAYPFRSHGVDDPNNSYSIDGRISVFFTVDGQTMSFRPGAANEALHIKKDSVKQSGYLGDSTISFSLQKQAITSSNIAKDPTRPVQLVGLMGNVDGVGEKRFFRITYQWIKEEWDSDNKMWKVVKADPDKGDILDDGTMAEFYALNADGVASSDFSKAKDFAAKMRSGGVNVKANAAVWVRLEDSQQKTVDLVPACAADDSEFNGGNASQILRMMRLGDDYPLMHFDVKMAGQTTTPITPPNCLNQGSYDLVPYVDTVDNPKIVVNDPRYNHLPENWYVIGSGALAAQDWLTETDKMLGQNGCDGDIFMSTSDQGIMQSVYELAFLPRLTGLTKDTIDAPETGFYPKTMPARNAFAQGADSAKDYNVMWRTYRCYDSNGQVADPFEKIGLTCGENGPKVNPYSDSKKVLMAAFANTPHDWRMASTNNEDVVDMSAAQFNAKHAWNAYSSEPTGKLCWDCLEGFAEAFADEVRAEGDWEQAFRNLDWSKDKRKILDSMEQLDSDDSDLYGVDKKFLYGFWHDSFAVRQQLFLIFLRAEPMMMGGGVSGQVPPQLGARAVALVWRDPTQTKGPGNKDTTKLNSDRQGYENIFANPHRTRVLFYHQFD